MSSVTSGAPPSIAIRRTMNSGRSSIVRRRSAAQAIVEAWRPDAEVPPELASLLRDGKLGETILRSIALFQSGAEGNHADLTGALATLRRVGLEDTARRAAIQQILLSDEGAPL